MADLLRRAAELQVDADERAHSLEDIQHAAAEVGIDPAMIEQLAAQPPAPAYSWPRLLGPPPTLDSTTVAATTAPIPIQDIVNAIRSAGGRMGEVHQVGNGVEWQQTNDYSVLRVSVAPTTGGTAVRVGGEFKWRLTALAGIGGFGGAVVGAVLATAAAAPSAPSTALVVGAAVLGTVVGLGGARMVWTAMMQRARGQLVLLQSRIHAILARHSTS